MPSNGGDHVCAIYSTTEELTRDLASFLAEGLRTMSAVGTFGDGPEIDSIRAAPRKQRIPLDVINGALCTHPVAGSHGQYGANPFYDPATSGPTASNRAAVLEELAELERSSAPPYQAS